MLLLLRLLQFLRVLLLHGRDRVEVVMHHDRVLHSSKGRECLLLLELLMQLLLLKLDKTGGGGRLLLLRLQVRV